VFGTEHDSSEKNKMKKFLLTVYEREDLKPKHRWEKRNQVVAVPIGESYARRFVVCEARDNQVLWRTMGENPSLRDFDGTESAVVYSGLSSDARTKAIVVAGLVEKETGDYNTLIGRLNGELLVGFAGVDREKQDE